MKRRKFLLRAASLLIGFAVAVIFIELLLHLFPPELLAFKRMRKPDDRFHHRLDPSQEYISQTAEFSVHVKTNSIGLRDNEWIPGRANEKRIIVLGDSFIEGVGVEMEDGLVQLLENRLNAYVAGKTRYEVFNFGVVGYSPIIEYLILKERGLKLKPDVVILCYDMTDVQEDFEYGQDADFDSSGAPLGIHSSIPGFGKNTHFPRSRLKTWVQENSYIYSLIAQSLARNIGSKVEIRPGDITSGRYAHTADSTGKYWKKYFERSEFYVGLIADLCHAHGIQFVLSVHPRGHQLNTMEWRVGRIREGLEMKVYVSAIFASLEHFASSSHIPFLNMLQTFKRQSKGDLYYSIDGHWTRQGNLVAADTLFAFLVEHGIVGNGPGK